MSQTGPMQRNKAMYYKLDRLECQFLCGIMLNPAQRVEGGKSLFEGVCSRPCT